MMKYLKLLVLSLIGVVLFFVPIDGKRVFPSPLVPDLFLCGVEPLQHFGIILRSDLHQITERRVGIQS